MFDHVVCHPKTIHVQQSILLSMVCTSIETKVCNTHSYLELWIALSWLLQVHFLYNS